MREPAYRVDDGTIEAAKTVSLIDVIRPCVNLKKVGGEWVGICPFHKEKTPSFHVYHDHYHCFGCGSHGDVIEWTRRTRRLGFRDSVVHLTSAATFEEGFKAASAAYAKDPFAACLSDDQLRLMRLAEEIWNTAITFSEPSDCLELPRRYLSQRGIGVQTCSELRFHPNLPCRQTSEPLPALIARVQSTGGRMTAIQRIFLDPITGLKAAIPMPRKSLGPMGTGSFQYGRAGSHLGIAESVEKAMAASQVFSLPVWGTIGVQRFTKIAIPRHVRRLTIFADSDEIGMSEAIRASDFWECTGLQVEIMPPPRPYKDWDEYTKAVNNGRG